MPDELQLQLLWWKNEEPPQWEVQSGGRTQRGSWEKDGDGWRATISTGEFFSSHSTRPLRFDVSCESLKAQSHILDNTSGALKVLSSQQEVVQLHNAWYQIEVTPRYGGAITQWTECERGANYFATRQDMVQPGLDWGSHIDRYRTGPWGGWADKPNEVTLDSLDVRRQHQTSRVQMAGSLEDDLRTSVVYSLCDEWPLLVLEREWTLHPKKDDKKEGPQEPIDDLRLMQVSFRSAARPERDGAHGSRLLCADNDRLCALRPVEQAQLMAQWSWTLRDGWAILEHPQRGENLLYLFDTANPPHPALWSGPHVITLEPIWPAQSLRPGGAIGYTLGLSSGELCGASAAGGWVASRVQHNDKVLCSLVARLREPQATAIFKVGEQQQEVAIQSTFIPGLGTVLLAKTEFEADENAAWDVTVGGIAARRLP
jgi:hypothetical protein